MTLLCIILAIVALVVAIPFVVAISSAVIASSKMIIIAIPALIIAAMLKRLLFGKEAYIEPRRHKKKSKKVVDVDDFEEED